MSTYHDLTIKAPGPTGRGVEIALDGRPLNGVRRLQMSMAANDLTSVVIEMIPGSLDIALPQLEAGKGIILELSEGVTR